jgi:hypothetical protein
MAEQTGSQFHTVARKSKGRPAMQQPQVKQDEADKSDSFFPKLMAIVESDRPQHERIDRALKLCATHAASIRAKHGVLDGCRPTREDIARVRRELGALQSEMLRRETVYPDSSITQNVLRASIRVIEIERNSEPALNPGS